MPNARRSGQAADERAIPGTSSEPRDVVAALERAPRLPDGSELRFRGYGVVGPPLASGHVLALRRFPASSLGPGYTCVWHRDPGGRWTFHADVPPPASCAHFHGDGAAAATVDRITLTWTGSRSLTVVVEDARLAWAVHLRPTARCRLLSAAAAAVPDRLWRDERTLAAAAAVAGRALDLGRLSLSGRTPRGYHFRHAPQRVWLVDGSTALMDGHSLGPPDDDAATQSRLGDFWIPRRGVFAVGASFFDERNDGAPGPA